jgi:hypothetical protein
LENNFSESQMRCSRTILKKCCGDKLVLGWFLGLGFAASAGHVPRSAGKCGEVQKSAGETKKIRVTSKVNAVLFS